MSLALELALDRVEAIVAAELPAHVRAFARAHAAGRRPPVAPPIVADPATLAVAERALREPALARRGRALWRLTALLAVEHDITGVGGEGWPGVERLARAREAAAQRRWGRGFLAVAHDVFEVGPLPAETSELARVPPIGAEPIDPPSGAFGARFDVPAILDLWHRLTDLPPPEIVVADARPRTFVVRPGEAIVVVRADATINAWSLVAHELGHAWAAIAGYDLPRALDEAVALTAARTLERDHPAARRVHDRQHAIAIALAATERALYAGERARTDHPPPWALFHDPGAQAAYVAAHHRAWPVDRLDDLRPHLP